MDHDKVTEDSLLVKCCCCGQDIGALQGTGAHLVEEVLHEGGVRLGYGQAQHVRHCDGLHVHDLQHMRERWLSIFRHAAVNGMRRAGACDMLPFAGCEHCEKEATE